MLKVPPKVFPVTTTLLLAGLLAQSVIAADLGLRLAAAVPDGRAITPLSTGYPIRPSDLSSAVSVLSTLGVDALVVEPSVSGGEGAVRSPAASADGTSERGRLDAILTAADSAGMKVYLEGFEPQVRDGALSEEAEAVRAAIAATLDYLGSHPSLAGFVWQAPPLEPVPGTPLPADIRMAADAWISGMSSLVVNCGELCSSKGRSFIVATDSVFMLAAAVPELPEGVQVWRTTEGLRDPSLEPQRASLEAAIHGDAGGVWLDWDIPHEAGVSRAVCMGIAAGCGTVIAGDVSLALHSEGVFREDVVAQLAAFAEASEAGAGRALCPPYSDAILLVEPVTVLTERLAPPAARCPDQITGSLVLLNESGRSVSMALAPPPRAPEATLQVTDPEGQPADAATEAVGTVGDDDPRAGPRARRTGRTRVSEPGQTVVEAVTPPRPAPILILCNGARVTDEYLDALLDSTDRGFTTVLYADVATEDLTGGSRAAESRDRQDARLPMERSRPFRQPVSRVVVTSDLAGTSTRAGRELDASAAEGQWIYRGKARPDCTVLAEWFEPSAPALVTSPRGAGRVLVYNGAPGLSRVNLFGDVLTHLGVPVTRPVEVDPEDPPREEAAGLGRHGLVPNFPYERPTPVQVIPPPTIDPTLLTAETDSAYDAYVVGHGGVLYAFGYRAAQSGSFRRLSGIETFMGPWNMVAIRGDQYLTTCRETRLPEALDAHVFDTVAREFVHVIYRKDGQRAVCSGPGLYLLTARSSDHALVRTGGARVVRAQRAVDEDAILIEVDRPALLELALDPERFAGCRVDVTLAPYGAREPVPLGSSQWWVTSDDRLFVDALGRIPILVHFAPAREEVGEAVVTVTPGENALPVMMDGEEAVLLDRYANATACLTFEHWATPDQRNTLSIVGVRGDLYGEGGRGADAPARLRVTVNGKQVYQSEAPYRTYRPDGLREEWSALAIPVPKEALRRGHNEVVIQNAGPNAVAISSATIRFEKPAE